MPLLFYSTCVDWPRSQIEDLSQMIDDATQVTRNTFLRHVNRSDLRHLERSLSYALNPKSGLTMAGDWYVTYHKSQLRGKPAYYFKHSSIEYVFASL
jgi:hypothetical protein